jgi:hypothetical protein
VRCITKCLQHILVINCCLQVLHTQLLQTAHVELECPCFCYNCYVNLLKICLTPSVTASHKDQSASLTLTPISLRITTVWLAQLTDNWSTVSFLGTLQTFECNNC